MKAALTALALVLAGCARSPAPGVLALARGGPVTVAEVQARLRTAAQPVPPADAVERYRKAAEDLVTRRALLASVPDHTAALRKSGSSYTRLERRLVAELFAQRELALALEVSSAEVERHYLQHRGLFRQQAQRMVWHLFRRHRDESKAQETFALLTDLRRRAAAGEPFRQLAREYSDSETRALDGRLGLIGRGRLPPALERVVFALPVGAVSEALPVPGGAVLVHVSEATEEKEFALEDVRAQIASRLRWEKLERGLARALEGLTPPAGASVLDRETLARKLATNDEREEILSLGDVRWTAGEFAREAGQDEDPPLPGDRPDQAAWQRYRLEALLQQLYPRAVAEGFADRPDVREATQAVLRAQGAEMLIQHLLEERARARLEGLATEIERFHQDNRFLFQSPLRLRIRTLTVRAGRAATRQAAELERWSAAVSRGELTLEEAAARVGGRVLDGGWLEGPALAAIEPKVRIYLLQMNGPGLTPPFQLNHFVNVICVDRREEPKPLPYEQVAQSVREEYYRRFQHRLRADALAQLLKDEGFRFLPERVPGPEPVARPGS